MEDNVVNKPCEINSMHQVANEGGQEFRVLAIDSQVFSLQYLCAVLHSCNYKVKTITSAAGALEILSVNKHGFDIVLVDVDSANLDGFKLLETIGLDMYLPVIMVTGDGTLENLKKGLLSGAVDYIIKPVELQKIKSSVKHGVAQTEIKDPEQSSKEQKMSDDQNLKHSNSNANANAGIIVKVEEDETNIQTNDVSTRSQRKKRLWTPELDAKFMNAVRILEKSSKVSPKRILKIMNEPGLTPKNVSSHLQKFRLLSNKRKAETNQQKFEYETVTRSSPIRSTKRRKRDVPKLNADHESVPCFNTAANSILNSLVQNNPNRSLLHGTTFQCFDPGNSSSVPFYPPRNAILARETDVANFRSPLAVTSVTNLVSGTTVDCTNNVSQINGDTNGTMKSSSTTENLEGDDEVSELVRNFFGEGSFSFCSLLNDEGYDDLTDAV